MSGAPSRYRLTDVARAYVSFLARAEPVELATLKATLQPYRAPHLAACWEAGWYSHQAQFKLGEGLTAPELGRHGARAWMRGHQARLQAEAHTQPQED